MTIREIYLFIYFIRFCYCFVVLDCFSCSFSFLVASKVISLCWRIHTAIIFYFVFEKLTTFLSSSFASQLNVSLVLTSFQTQQPCISWSCCLI